MVKIPSLDELKKMGSELMDTAKASKLGSMVDKVAANVASVASKKTATPMDESVQGLFQQLQTTLRELNELQVKQISLMKQLENQTAELVKKVQAAPSSTTQSSEDKFE